MTENVSEIVKLWMPLTKNTTGQIVGILSDTSIDRDGELMGEELLQSWANNKSLPILADHTNKMSNWIGGWTQFNIVKNGEHTALIAQPVFFSEQANPLAGQIKKQIDEAMSMGLNAGISIGAIPRKSTTKKVDNQERKVYVEAELVEASFVPVQSNRHSYAMIARSFNICPEVEKMVEEKIVEKTLVQETPIIEEKCSDKKETPEEKKKREEEEEAKKKKEAEVTAEKAKSVEVEKTLRAELETVKKALEEMKTKAVMTNAPTVESLVKAEKKFDATIENMLKARVGLLQK